MSGRAPLAEPAAEGSLERLREAVQFVASQAAAGVLVVECLWVGWTLLGNDPRFPVGVDYRIARDAAARWLAGGTFYLPSQLAGPYEVFAPPGAPANVMYPPVALWLFVPFVYLPAWLWWAIPISAVAMAFRRLRPARWTWPIVALLWLYPRAPEAIMNGNPVIWALGAVSLGVAYGAPAALALLKPTLAPFALWGASHRMWWFILGAGMLAAVPFGTMWFDYARVVTNARAPTAYLVHDYPLMTAPLLAWLGRDGRPLSAIWTRLPSPPGGSTATPEASG